MTLGRMTGWLSPMVFLPVLATGQQPYVPRHTLFNPTPHAEMRELSTDRPDKTESPYTVPAGRLQFEIDVITVEHHRSGASRSRHLEVMAANLKAGLLHNVDLQFVVAPVTRDRVTTGTMVTAGSGVGDVTGRLKVNLWGNDGGPTAAAAMPYVTFSPREGGGRDVSFGVVAPFGFDPGGGWGVGAMVVAGAEPRDSGSGKRATLESSVTAGHAVLGPIGGYLEFWNLAAFERGAAWQASADAGLTFAIGENVQLDAGINLGLNRATPKANPFLGFTVRF